MHRDMVRMGTGRWALWGMVSFDCKPWRMSMRAPIRAIPHGSEDIMVKIEKGIPIPAGRKAELYPWLRDMEVGDSAFIDEWPTRVQARLQSYAKKLNVKFVTIGGKKFRRIREMEVLIDHQCICLVVDDG